MRTMGAFNAGIDVLAGSKIPTKPVAHPPALREKAPAQFKKDPNRLSQNELLALPGSGHCGILPASIVTCLVALLIGFSADA